MYAWLPAAEPVRLFFHTPLSLHASLRAACTVDIRSHWRRNSGFLTLILACGSQAVRSPALVHSPHQRDERFRLLFRAKPHPRARRKVGLNRAAVENTVLSALHIIYCGASLYCFSFPQASAAPPPNLQARTPSKLFGFVFACKFALFSPPYKKRPCFPAGPFFVWWG